jgi:(R,R)-butanediol dehydrogenase / meso-butanediol dehydrogenase / diacetyl reductase
MKAAALVGLKKIEIQERPIPAIQSGEVLVKVQYCGICGSDVHGYQTGVVIPVGTVMGHEFSGVVAEVGGQVYSVRPGDRVAVKPAATCLSCYWCRRGQYSLCPKRREGVIGVSPGNDGAYAEYVRVREPGQRLFKLPAGLAMKEAALIEPLSIGLHAVRLSRFRSGDCALIIGAGMIGLGLLQFLKMEGTGRVIMLEVSEKKSRIARALGADVVFNPVTEGGRLKEQILDLAGGIGVDVVFDCAGVASAFQSSLEVVKSGGQVLVIGLHEQRIPVDFLGLLHREIELKGVFGSYNEFKEVIDPLASGKIGTDLLISGVIPFGDIVERGFEPLVASRDLIKILVRIGAEPG